MEEYIEPIIEPIEQPTPQPPQRLFVRLIDEQGYFISDEFVDEDKLEPTHILTVCPAGFYRPRWNGTEWVEGGQAPEPTPPEPTIEERLNKVETDVVTVKEILEVIYG